jgi:hypothetical protein
MFRTVFPSIIRSLRMYIQYQVSVTQVLWLLANGNERQLHSISFPLANSQHNLYDTYLILYVQS